MIAFAVTFAVPHEVVSLLAGSIFMAAGLSYMAVKTLRFVREMQGLFQRLGESS